MMKSKFFPLAMRSPTLAFRKCFLDGIFGLIGQTETNDLNRELAYESNELQQQLAKEANQLNYQMFQEANQFSHDEALAAFNRENEYNTPKAQAARLVEAGFNPAAALDKGALASAVSNSASPASASPLSAVMPNVVTPTMQNPAAQFHLADSLLKLSQAKKVNKESDRYDELVDKQLDELVANIANTEADTAYKSFTLELDQMFARAERKRGLDEKINNIKKIGAEFALAVQQGESEKAKQLLLDAQRIYTNTQNDSLKQNAPIIHDNLIKTGQKILAERDAARASANSANASAKLSNEQAETVKARRDEIVRLDKELADEKTLSNEFTRDSFSKRLTEITKRLNLTESQTKYFEQQIERAKKENNIFYIREAVNVLRQISDGVSQYIPTNGFNGTGSSLQMPSGSSSTAPEWSFLYGN